MGLEGEWYNQSDKAKLDIMPIGAGVITGTYEIPAGTPGCPKGRFPVQGRTDIGRGGSTFGFAINWHNAESTTCNSTTVWVGNYTDANGVETLTTHWITATATTYQTGEDTFKRTP